MMDQETRDPGTLNCSHNNVRIRSVKNAVLLPIFFLFLFLIISLLFTALNLLQSLSMAQEPGTALVVSTLPRSLLHMLPASCVFALLFLFPRMVRKPGFRLLSFLLLAATASAVLIFVQRGIEPLVAQEKAVEPAAMEPAAVGPAAMKPAAIRLDAGKFFTHGRGIFFADEREDTRYFLNTVLIDDSDPVREWKMEFFPRLQFHVEENLISVKLSEISQPDLKLPAERNVRQIFRTDAMIDSLVRDYQLLTQEIEVLMKAGGSEFYLLCISLATFVLGSYTLMRTTRWPLFNFLLVLLLIRGVLYLYALIRLDFADELGKLITESSLARILPSLVMIGLGVLLILIDILFVPSRSGEEEGAG